MSKSHPGKQLSKEEKAKSGQQIRSSLQEMLDVPGPRGLLPGSAAVRWQWRKSLVFPSVRVVPCL